MHPPLSRQFWQDKLSNPNRLDKQPAGQQRPRNVNLSRFNIGPKLWFKEILDFKVCPSPKTEAPASLKALPGAGDRDMLGQILLLAPRLKTSVVVVDLIEEPAHYWSNQPAPLAQLESGAPSDRVSVV